MTEACFSRIVIIQSLPAGDSPTGRHLRDANEPTAEALCDISVEFIDAHSANDFWTALDRIHESVQSTMDYPILHLECHGVSDGTGLSLADGTPIPWFELKSPLVTLNQATRCNLFVTLAAGHGAMLQDILDTQDRSPCLGLLGPSGEVSPLDLKGSYSAFFLELLRSTNADAALSSIRDSPQRRARYFLFTAEDIGRIVDSQWAGLDPAQMGLGPVHASTPILKRHGLGLNGLDAWEINEAFAAQVQGCIAAWQDAAYFRELLGLDAPLGALDEDKLNVDGGAIALGHPVGASGARIALHLLQALRRRASGNDTQRLRRCPSPRWPW